MVRTRLLIACGIAVMAGAVVPPTGLADASPGRCTITGTPRNDVLRGTSGDDVICGLGGNDTLSGLGGNDRLIGGAGRDVLHGGTGNDILEGNSGNDRLVGASGLDTLLGDGGNDTLSGNAGNDILSGGPGRDSMSGGPGDDMLSGGDGSDVLMPGSGANVCAEGDRVVGSCEIDVSGPTASQTTFPSTIRAGETVTFSWSLTDPAGIQYTSISIGWSSGIYSGCGFGQSATLTGGTPTNGTWSLTCTFPSDAVATTYSVKVVMTDMFGNYSATDWSELRIEGDNTDASPPAYSSISIDDVARLGELMTIRWSVTDSSGVEGAIMWVAGSGGYRFANSLGKSVADYAYPLDRSCNDTRTSCDYTQTVRLAADEEPGTWALWISTVDIHGNKVLEQVLTFAVLAG